MSDWLHEPDPAHMLAAWTKLKPDEFAPLYQRIDAAAAAEHWSILALHPEPILEACKEAQRVGFIRELARRVADAESRQQRDPGDIDALLVVLGNPAVTQGIVDPRLGFPGRSTLRALDKTMLACAKITVGGQPAGTGFLVGPDLVLTAGHVVLDTVKEGGSEVFSKRLRKDVRFFFAADGETYDQDVPPAPPCLDPLVLSAPFASPPNVLEPRLSDKSAGALDFALVRLARQVNGIAPLDIQAPPTPRNEAVWVVGFPGGGEVAFPGATIEMFDKQAARVFHKANTSAGMSGGCCIGPDGRPVALHEGTLPLRDENGRVREENGTKLSINRAVALSAIRARLAAEKADPLSRRPRAPGVAFLDRSTLERWRAEARRLACSVLEAWDQAVQDRLGLSPTQPELPAFHPWFARKTLEAWIDEASAKPLERVRYVNGAPGVGKSFTARIAAEKIPDPARDLLVFDPTVITKWDWEDALTRLGASAQSEIFRTMAGELRHETLPAIVDRLGRIDGVPRRADQPLFVAIDFERDTSGSARKRFENTPWPPFIVLLAGQPWARLLLIGLSDGERDDFDDMFAADSLAVTAGPDDIALEPIDGGDIVDFLKAAFRAQGTRVSRGDLTAIVADWDKPGFRHQVAEMQTVEAVLFAMERTRDLWRPSDEVPGGQGG